MCLPPFLVCFAAFPCVFRRLSLCVFTAFPCVFHRLSLAATAHCPQQVAAAVAAALPGFQPAALHEEQVRRPAFRCSFASFHRLILRFCCTTSRTRRRGRTGWRRFGRHACGETSGRRAASALAGLAAAFGCWRRRRLRHGGWTSRRRDCHSAAPPSPFSRCFNSDGERASAKMTVSPMARLDFPLLRHVVMFDLSGALSRAPPHQHAHSHPHTPYGRP